MTPLNVIDLLHRRRSNVPTNQPRALEDPYITEAGDNILDLKFSAPFCRSAPPLA